MHEREAPVPQQPLERVARAPRLVFVAASGAVSLLCLIGLFRLL